MSAIEIPGYKIIKTLGVGGQATVYLAIQQGFDREVALKVMSPALAADPSFGERFIREAKIVATLSHSRIVTVYDVGESGSFYYLAMEYMRGEELKTRIANGMKAKEALIIIAKLAQALHFAHNKGYIHRDVKSENILFDEDDQPVLTDFGIAKASNSSTQMTQTGKLIGTPEYMSPEQCRGRQLDGRSDLYSLGIILYEMLTRKVPFTGEDSVSVCIQHVTKPVAKLPARLNHLQWILDSLLAKNPADRFQTGKELSDSIQAFLSGGAVKKTIHPTGQNRTVTSEVVEQSFDDDGFQDQSFELNDNFDVEQRINVSPEKKSPITFIVVSMLLVIATVAGFSLRANWLPQAQQALGVDWFPEYIHSEESPVVAIKDDDNRKTKTVGDVQSVDIPEKTTQQRVEQLIQQADTLAQYSPHELTDIQQAMDLLITAKSLSPNNTEVIRVKSNLVDIALEESSLSAYKSQFDRAADWIELVENADRDNPDLLKAKNNVDKIKLNSEQQNEQETQQVELLSNYLSSADEAIAAGRLSAPEKSNAIYFLEQAELISPEDPRIEQGFSRIESRYVELIDKMVDKRDFSKANRYLNQVDTLPVRQVDVTALRKKVSSAQKRHDTYRQEQARKAALAKTEKENEEARLQKLADPLVQMRLQSNLQAAKDLKGISNLVMPIGNNALEKYRSVLDIDPTNSEAISGITEIEKTIVTNIEVALSNSVSKAASEWIEKLTIFDSNYSKLQEFQLQLEELELSLQIQQQSDSVPNLTSVEAKPLDETVLIEQVESNVTDQPVISVQPDDTAKSDNALDDSLTSEKIEEKTGNIIESQSNIKSNEVSDDSQKSDVEQVENTDTSDHADEPIPFK